MGSMSSIAIGRFVERGGEALLGGPHRLLALVARCHVADDDHDRRPALVLDPGRGRLDRDAALVVEPDQLALDVGQPGVGGEPAVALGHRRTHRRRDDLDGRLAPQLLEVLGADQAQRLLVGEDEAAVLDDRDGVGRQLDERAVALLGSAQLVHCHPPLSFRC